MLPRNQGVGGCRSYRLWEFAWLGVVREGGMEVVGFWLTRRLWSRWESLLKMAAGFCLGRCLLGRESERMASGSVLSSAPEEMLR